MTTLENRPNTALLVVDVQTTVVQDAHERDVVVGTTPHVLCGNAFDAGGTFRRGRLPPEKKLLHYWHSQLSSANFGIAQ